MADIRIECDTPQKDAIKLPNGAAIYVDGHKLRHVLSIVPNLTQMDEVATVTITLGVGTFMFGPKTQE
jgi:hypothetical protein